MKKEGFLVWRRYQEKWALWKDEADPETKTCQLKRMGPSFINLCTEQP